MLSLQCDQFIVNLPTVLRVGAMEASLEDITEAPDISVSRVGAIDAQCEDITESHEGLHAIINAPLSMPKTTSSTSHRHRAGGSSQDKTS